MFAWKTASHVDTGTRRSEILRVVSGACEHAGPAARIHYRTEWLGYLPFGQYHWVDVECDGEWREITRMLPEGWTMDDLQALAAEGRLRQVSEDIDPADDVHDIVYELVREG